MRYPERLNLANLPTPIVRLPRLSGRLGKEIYVWRDDCTGAVESGNKVRKLEFLAADAVAQRATRLITCGGPQSNHARATAWVARRLGMDVTVVVRMPPQGGFDPEAPAQGNLLLLQIAGAQIRYIPYADYRAGGGTYDAFLAEEADAARARGERPYVIGEGGSVPLGSFGYIHGVEEMLSTWRASGPGTDAPDSIVTALGSGGTLAGLHLGLERQMLPTDQLFAVNVCDSAAYFQKRVGTLLGATAEAFGLKLKSDRLQILDGHFGEGYARATDDDLRFYAAIAREDGLLLDPVYTGKAFKGMLAELSRDPTRFGSRILFLMSGGAFGTFAFHEQYARALGNKGPR